MASNIVNKVKYLYIFKGIQNLEFLLFYAWKSYKCLLGFENSGVKLAIPSEQTEHWGCWGRKYK